MIKELNLKDIVTFATEQKLGKIIGINYRENISSSPQPYLAEAFSIEITVMGSDNKKRGYIFSKHGLANIYDHETKKYAYKVDSEELFSIENPELHKLTYSWIKMLASFEHSQKYIEEETLYRKNIHARLKSKREEAGAVRSFYKSEYTKLEDCGLEKTRNGIINKKYFNEYDKLCTKLSAVKQLQSKILKHLEQRLVDIKESY